MQAMCTSRLRTVSFAGTIAIWCLLSSSLLNAANGIPTLKSDHKALLAIIKSARPSAPFLANWTGEDPCADSWLNVTCSPEGRVTSLDLSPGPDDVTYFAFAGGLPPEIGNLTALTNLRISSAPGLAGGAIPPQLSQLSLLSSLDLSSNGLTGPIPPSLGALSSLTLLDLSSNNLTGTIPSSLADLSSCNDLILARNSLDGPVPDDLSRLAPSLMSLDLSGNRLSGGVPPWVSEFSILLSLSLAGNGLMGPIPASLGRLSMLQQLNLSRNKLTGPVPPPLLFDIIALAADLSFNSLTGGIPSNGSWDLSRSDVQGNFFSGAPPPLFAPDRVAGNCFTAADGQRDSGSCAGVYPGVQCGPCDGAAGEVPGLSGLCQCSRPLRLRAVFVADNGSSVGNFSASVNATLAQIAEAADVGLRQVSLVNFSSAPLSEDAPVQMHYVDLRFDILPASGSVFLPNEEQRINRTLSEAAVKVPFFRPGFMLVPSLTEAITPALLMTVAADGPDTVPAPAPSLSERAPLPKPMVTATAPRDSKGGGIGRTPIALGAAIVLLFVASLIILTFLQLRSSYQRISMTIPENSLLKMWTLPELQAATNNFHEANLVGSGSSGVVYRGDLAGVLVAIKRLKVESSKGWDAFAKEMATIGSFHNRNLVTLRGYCVDGKEHILVYDFMANGSLEDALFKAGGEPSLSWSVCLDILLGAARAVAYLHEDCKDKIIHRNIKPANILLDSHFEARVADFGLARCIPLAELRATDEAKEALAGGYMAPEFASSGELTEKSDVYSVGMVMLAVISHQQPHSMRDDKAAALPVRVFILAQEGRLNDLVAPRFASTYDEDEAYRFLSVAVLCIHPTAQLRPAMGEVVQMLSGHMDIPAINMRAIDTIVALEAFDIASGKSDVSTQVRSDVKVAGQEEAGATPKQVASSAGALQRADGVQFGASQ